jgi:hypothetical protein
MFFTRSVHLRNHPRLHLVCWECSDGVLRDVGQCLAGDTWWRPTWSLVLHTAAFTKVNKAACFWLIGLIEVPCHASHQSPVTSRRSVAAETRVRSRASPCKIGVEESGSETGFFPSTSVFPCQNHFNNASYTFYPLLQALYKLSNWHHR